jgi:hypothetical protein
LIHGSVVAPVAALSIGLVCGGSGDTLRVIVE